MPPSPLLDREGVLHLVVECNGRRLPGSIGVVSVHVHRAVGAIPTAQLVVEDGDLQDDRWPLADGDTFEPGSRIRIAAGYGDRDEPVFEGIVVQLGMQISGERGGRLVVDCCHPAMAMTVERRNASYADQTDSAVIAGIIGRHGLAAMDDPTGATPGGLTQFQASDGFGAFFVPEVGDEVVVGFFDHDPAQPVVLGSLYGSRNRPARALAAPNDTKALVTRSRHRLEFDEEDRVITVTTPSLNRVVLSDKDRCVRLEDQNGNRVELGGSGISLDTPGDLKITARGGISVAARGALSIASSADVRCVGLNVACEAQVGFSGKGGATAELSATGQTTVTGALVMINLTDEDDAMPPAARLTDLHVCPMVTLGTPPIPHVGGPVIGPGVPTVLICKLPASVVGDNAVCVGPPDVIVTGSATVLIGGRPAARVGDSTAHGGSIVMGSPTVIIGG